MPGSDKRAARRRACHIAGTPSARADRAQAQVGVVLERLGDRPLGLRERARRGVGGLGQRAAEGGDHEGVGLLLEREGGGLAGAADDAAGGAGEADEVVALAAGRAAGQVRGEAGGQQELQAEGEGVGAAGASGSRSSSASSLASRW